MCLAIPIILLALLIPGILGLCALGFQRLVYSPLSIPKEEARLRKREFWLAFMTLLMAGLGGLAHIFLLVFYPIVLYRHIRESRLSATPGASLGMPRIPAISLQELMVMMFSLGAMPPITEAIGLSRFNQKGDNTAAAYYMLYAGLLFPLCFVCALYRLHIRKVPLGWLRMLYLFLYPYAMFACLALGYLVPMGIFGSWRVGGDFWLIFAVPAGIALAMYLISRAAARAGEAAVSASADARLSSWSPSTPPDAPPSPLESASLQAPPPSTPSSDAQIP